MGKKIAVAADLKQDQKELLQFAERFKNHFNASLYVVHVEPEVEHEVVPILDLSDPNHFPEQRLNKKMNEDQVDFAKNKLRKMVNESLVDPAYTQVTVLLGDVNEELIKFTENHEFDLVICGITEDWKVSTWTKSTPLKIFNEINAPLLIIPEKYYTQNLGEITFAYDDTLDLEANWRSGEKLANKLKANYKTVRVFDRKVEYYDYINKASNLLKNNDFPIYANDVYSAIMGFLIGSQSNLLILNHVQMDMLDILLRLSTTKSFLVDAPIPLLIFNEEMDNWNLLNG